MLLIVYHYDCCDEISNHSVSPNNILHICLVNFYHGVSLGTPTNVKVLSFLDNKVMKPFYFKPA